MRKIIDFPQHFWDCVEKTEGCWWWKLSCRSYRNGLPRYGQVSVDGKNKSAHRVAWELTFGPIPNGMDVLHKCDNPAVVVLTTFIWGMTLIMCEINMREGE